MAKKKIEAKRAVNKYPHNLHKATILNDDNTILVKGVRYTISGLNLINIETGQRYTTTWEKVKDYFK